MEAKEVGERIAQARREAGGMTQEELGGLVGVTKRAVQLWEAGETIPYRHLAKLEGVLQKPTAWLLYGEEGLQHNPLEKLELDLRELRDLGAYRHDLVMGKLEGLQESVRELSRQVADIRDGVGRRG